LTLLVRPAEHQAPRSPIYRLHPIQGLTPEDLDDLHAIFLANGRRNKGGGPLNAKTVPHVHAVVHQALADVHRRKGSVARRGVRSGGGICTRDLRVMSSKSDKSLTWGYA
jgi:hypothetical protein